MKKEALIFLKHIVECIEKIENYSEDMSRTEFEKSDITQDALIRRIEIIGEATRNIPIEITRKYSEVPWKKMAGMRDVLIHHYYGVSLEQTWDVIKKDIPSLKKQIKKIIKDLKEEK